MVYMLRHNFNFLSVVIDNVTMNNETQHFLFLKGNIILKLLVILFLFLHIIFMIVNHFKTWNVIINEFQCVSLVWTFFKFNLFTYYNFACFQKCKQIYEINTHFVIN